MPNGKPNILVIWGDDIGSSAEDRTIAELLLPRGVLKCRTTDEVSTEPVDTKRMETIDHAVKALQKFLAKD